MSKTNIAAKPAFLATREKLPDRFLFCGRIKNRSLENEGFFFYLIEVLSPWFPSTKVKKSICRTLEKSSALINLNDLDGFFEQTVSEVNRALEQLAEDGEKDWIGNLNAIIGFTAGKDIFIAQTGNVSGYVFRKGTISAVTDKQSVPAFSSPETTFDDITTGKIADGDRLIFANSELFNHFSLDRLRRLASDKSAGLAVLELFKSLRKAKIFGVNLILFEVGNTEDAETVDFPEIFYLDEPVESTLVKVKKKALPYILKIIEQGKTFSYAAEKNRRRLFKKTKQDWEERFGPKTAKFFTESNKRLAKTFSDAKTIINPTFQSAVKKIHGEEYLRKVRVRAIPYTKKTGRLTRFCLKVGRRLRGGKSLLLPQNRKYLYLALILMLIFSGYLKIKANNQELEKRSRVQAIANSYDDSARIFNEAKTELSFNKESSLSKFLEALSLAVKAAENKSSEEKASGLIREIKKSIDNLTKTTRITDPEPLFAFAGEIEKALLVGTEIYAVDAERKIFSADVRDKEPRLLASIGKENGKAISLSYAKTPNKIFIYTSQNKVLSLDVASNTIGEIKVEGDTGKWEEAKSIASYVSNIYLLDDKAGKIWKHIEKNGSYSNGASYADTNKMNIRNAIDLAVDGDFYVLRNDASVAKFTKGAYDPSFSLKNLPAPGEKIEMPAQISSDPDSSYLFILDKKLNRIVKFAKTGDFVNQYLFENIEIESFALNPKLQKLWVLAKSQIYEIDL